MANYDNRYLYQRGKAWNYKRRVPSKYKHVDARSKVRASLETKSLDIARIRRDAMERADEAYWRLLPMMLQQTKESRKPPSVCNLFIIKPPKRKL